MNLKSLFAGVALALGISSAAFGYTLADTTDVGDLDTFLAATTKAELGNANPLTEQTWVESILGYSVWYEDKTESVDLFVTLESSTVIAFALTSQPGHYVVKDSTNFVLLSNEQSLDWGVLDLSQYFGEHKLDDLQFSHVTEFGSHMLVPEPGTGALLFAGVMGLYFARRRTQTTAAA